MRVVIDTNVFISSFYGGNPRAIISLWARGHFKLCVSRPILDEYIEVLRRLHLDQQPECAELLSLLAHGNNVVFTAQTPALAIVADDPDDDRFIECAVALKANYIVTGDKALLRVKRYTTIEIVTPKEFLAHCHPEK